MSTKPASLSLQSFPAATREGRVLVDFGASWCPPCRALEPAFASSADRYAEQVGFAKVDIDEQPELARQHQVRSIPTVIAFENGQEVGRFTGAVSRTALDAIIDRFIGGEGFEAPRHEHHHHA